MLSYQRVVPSEHPLLKRCEGFAPIMASPWPLYQPPLTYPALVLHQWQLQQAAAEQVRDHGFYFLGSVDPHVDTR